jgi:serine/threonine protein kinase
VHRCRDHKTQVDYAIKIIKNKPVFSKQADKELEMLLLVRAQDKEGNPSNPTAQDPHLHDRERIATGGADLAETTKLDSDKEEADAGSRADGRHHHYIIQLIDSFEFRNHKCFVFPLCGKNLYEYLRDKNFVGLPMSFVKKVALQLFKALKHLNRLGIIHCDIKPENILLRDERTAAVVLVDFGSSCKVNQTAFSYVQSRFYRAPEVLLGIKYGTTI